MSIIDSEIKKTGITITALGRRMGVSRQTIYHWINKRYSPTAKQIIQLSKIFGISPNKILNDYKK